MLCVCDLSTAITAGCKMRDWCLMMALMRPLRKNTKRWNWGGTSPAQAWKDGRYHIATARLRPETYSFFADIEHIVCTRGDLIRFTHDVPMFGLMSARVKSLTTSGGN